MPEVTSEHGVGPESTEKEIKQERERPIAEVVEECLRRSKRATQHLRKQWIDNYDFIFSGRQWNVDRPSWRFSEVVNISLSTILTEVGIQTDSRPKIEYTAADPTDLEFAEILKQINDTNWSKPSNRGFGWQQKLQDHILDVKYADISWAEICWDPTLEEGLGDVGWKALAPEYCYWDPLAHSVDELRWFIYAEPTPTVKLKLEYPEKSDQIQSDIYLLGSSGSTDVDPNVDRAWRSSFFGNEFGDRYEREDRYGGEPMSLKIRCWIRDTTVDEVLEEKNLPNGEIKSEYVSKLRYPKGRYIVMQGKTVLEDRENGVIINGEVHPYEDGLFPVACLVNYRLPRKLHGMSEAPFVMGPQKIVNYVWSYGLDHMKMSMNPQWKVTHAASEIVDQITNEPGVVLEVPSMDSIQRQSGESMPAGYFNLLETAQNLFDKVQGLGEVSRGTPDPSVTSGLQFDSYVEAAQTRPRLKNRNVDEFLRQVGFLITSRELQFYTASRVFRITNKDGYPEHVEFYISNNGNQKVANIKKFTNVNGKVVDSPIQQVSVKGIPDIKIETGSSLPFAKSQKNAVAQSAFDKQAIDRLEYLKAVEWPNAEAVDKRMAEKEAQFAATQMKK